MNHLFGCHTQQPSSPTMPSASRRISRAGSSRTIALHYGSTVHLNNVPRRRRLKSTKYHPTLSPGSPQRSLSHQHGPPFQTLRIAPNNVASSLHFHNKPNPPLPGLLQPATPRPPSNNTVPVFPPYSPQHHRPLPLLRSKLGNPLQTQEAQLHDPPALYPQHYLLSYYRTHPLNEGQMAAPP